MDYSLIETFVVICEVKNLTRASELLYKTQPTISNRIQQLENMLGYSLLVREKGKQEIQLTERGKAFLPKARQFYEMYTNLFAPGEDVAESLLISSIASFQIPLICDVCKDLGAQLPTRFQIYTYQTEDVYNFISHKKIDLAIASAAHDVQGVVWEPLFQQTYYVAVPCEHPQGIQTISPDDLDVIQELYQPWDDDFYYWHRRVFHGKAPKMVIDSYASLKAMLEGSSYWAILQESNLYALMQDIPVQIYTLTDPPPIRTCYMLTNRFPDRKVVPLIRRFKEALCEKVKEYTVHI